MPLSKLNNETNNALRLSNISLVLGESYVRYKKNTSSENFVTNKGISPNNQWNNENVESFIQEPKHDLNKGLKTKTINKNSAKIVDASDNTTDQSVRRQEHSGRDTARILRSDSPTDRIDLLFPQTEIFFFQRLLLLTDELLGKPQDTDDLSIYDKVIETVETEFGAENSTLDINKIDFHLYERSNISSGMWRPAAVLSTTSTRSLELSDEWVTTVELVNVTVSLDRWSAEGEARAAAAPGAEPSSAAALSAVAACCALALATSTALLLRWVATRRRRRRRRRDAVLAPPDFTFPVDERRRVGEGMETMLSCWLQQLHEFGGPELERPDLLKQPPCVAPRAPSAPSSTCSVNRVTVDRRTRYKVPLAQYNFSLRQFS